MADTKHTPHILHHWCVF